jgi:hypothetical protein
VKQWIGNQMGRGYRCRLSLWVIVSAKAFEMSPWHGTLHSGLYEEDQEKSGKLTMGLMRGEQEGLPRAIVGLNPILAPCNS